MYQLTLCILACTKKQKYYDRLKDYVSSYGYILKNNEIKVEFVYLVEDEEKPTFLRSTDVWFNCPNIPMSTRFMKYIKECNNHSDWVMQVDDDSSTDIDTTLRLLNKEYEKETPLILMGGCNTDIELALQTVLKSMGLGPMNHFKHAWEPTVLTRSAIDIIKKWKRLDEFINLCIEHKPVFSDQPPYVLARLVGIPSFQAKFLHSFADAHLYSGISKQSIYSHIHYVTEKWDKFDNFKKAIHDGIIFETSALVLSYLETKNKDGVVKRKKEQEKVVSNVKKPLTIKSYKKESISGESFSISLVNKMYGSKKIVLTIGPSNEVTVKDMPNMLYRKVSPSKLFLFNKSTNKKIGEILNNKHTGEYLVSLDVDGKTSATSWIGRKSK